jgi:hypothetical protein
MGSIDKRLEDLKRLVASVSRPVRIHVVYEDAPEEVLYTVTVPASQGDGAPQHDEGAPER